MYTLDYNLAVESLNVPDKRTAVTTAFNKGLVAQTSNAHVQLFETYKDYVSVSVWVNGSYNRKDLVKYGKSIFQSSADTTNEPTFSDDWVLVSVNFLGNDFRLKIRGEKLKLEFALNTWFNTTFRQPPLRSSIYITTNEILSAPVFRVGIIEFESSRIYTDLSDEFVVNDYTFLEQYNLTIWLPIAVYNALATTNDARNSIIKSFADRYINAGITYNSNTY